MTMEVELETLEAACRAIETAQKAGQALRVFGRIAMPDSLRADEALMGVNRSEMASVFEFFGGLIEEHTTRASELIDRVGIGADRAASHEATAATYAHLGELSAQGAAHLGADHPQ